MKQAYILRRDGRDYQAPDLETLQSWARDGRVLPADMVYSPRYQSWYRARDLRELRNFLPSPEASNRTSARQQFWLRKGDQNYATDSLETILRWAGEGNIDPDDYIYHPSYGKWFRAGDSPQLASRFPAHFQRRNDGYEAAAGNRVRRTEDMGVERADSTAKTMMDLRSDDLNRALRQAAAAQTLAQQSGAQPAGAQQIGAQANGAQQRATQTIEDRRDTARSLRPVNPEALEQRSGTTNEIERQAVVARAEAERNTTAPIIEDSAVVLVEEAIISVDDAAVVSVDDAEVIAVEDAAPEVEEVSNDPPAAPDFDEDARFADTTGALKLFYDVARAFVVTRDLRPGEKMEALCQLPSTGDNFKGREKREIYRILVARMRTHLDQSIRPLEEGLDADNKPGFYLLVSRAETLIDVFAEADRVVGTRPPERFVIGNRARPKMSPAEEEAMLQIDAALTGLISVRKR